MHPVIDEFLTALNAIELSLNNVSLSNWISALTLKHDLVLALTQFTYRPFQLKNALTLKR